MAGSIKNLLSLGDDEVEKLRVAGERYVENKHSLQALTEKLINTLETYKT